MPSNDEHIWAEDYDRELTDVFAIQTDLAQKIAMRSRPSSRPAEKSQIERKPTENGEAYLAFVQAHNLSCAFEDLEKLKQSEQLYRARYRTGSKLRPRDRALLAIGKLDRAHVRSHAGAPRKSAHSGRASSATATGPAGGASWLAAFSYYYGDNNYDAALKEFEIAQRGLPNESEVYLSIGAIQRRQGKWAESTANLEKAVSLNPKDAWPLQNLSLNYQMLRNFAKANEAIDRAIALDPTAFEPWEVKSKLALFEKGDFSVAEKAFEALKSAPMTNEQRLNAANARANVFLLERKYREGLQEAENLPDDQRRRFSRALVEQVLLHRLCTQGAPGRGRSASGFPEGEERH